MTNKGVTMNLTTTSNTAGIDSDYNGAISWGSTAPIPLLKRGRMTSDGSGSAWHGIVPPGYGYPDNYYVPYPVPYFRPYWPWFERIVIVTAAPTASPEIKEMGEEIKKLRTAVEELTKAAESNKQEHSRLKDAVDILTSVDPEDAELLARTVAAVKLLLGIA